MNMFDKNHGKIKRSEGSEIRKTQQKRQAQMQECGNFYRKREGQKMPENRREKESH